MEPQNKEFLWNNKSLHWIIFTPSNYLYPLQELYCHFPVTSRGVYNMPICMAEIKCGIIFLFAVSPTNTFIQSQSPISSALHPRPAIQLYYPPDCTYYCLPHYRHQTRHTKSPNRPSAVSHRIRNFSQCNLFTLSWKCGWTFIQCDDRGTRRELTFCVSVVLSKAVCSFDRANQCK